jgi:hypothetical protein
MDNWSDAQSYNEITLSTPMYMVLRNGIGVETHIGKTLLAAEYKLISYPQSDMQEILKTSFRKTVVPNETSNTSRLPKP